MILGADVQYKYLDTRKERYEGTNGYKETYSVTGENTLSGSIFLETPQYMHSLGLGLSYLMIDSKKVEDNSGGILNRDSYAMGAVSAYGKFNLNRQMALIPKLAYLRYMDDKIQGLKIENQTYYMGGLDFRYTF